MQRQSLGSPASKLHSNGVLVAGTGTGTGTIVIKDAISNNLILHELQNQYLKDILATSSSAEDGEHKSQKPRQHKSILLSSSSSRLVHLIPVLTFLCFLILYLSSHDPSGKDLAQFSGFTTLSPKKALIDSTDIDDFGERFMDIEKNDSLAIRSMRNLQQQEEVNNRRHLHRKFGL